jgi:hypothetical protein
MSGSILSSLIPTLIVFGDKPVAWDTCVIPPLPIAIASVAAHSLVNLSFK